MAQKIPFMKLSGAGNDFVIIDNREKRRPIRKYRFCRKGLPTPDVCRRRWCAARRKYGQSGFPDALLQRGRRRGGNLRKRRALYLKVRLY